MDTEIIFNAYEQLSLQFVNLFSTDVVYSRSQLESLHRDLTRFISDLHRRVLDKTTVEPLRNELVYILLNIVEMRRRVNFYILTYPEMEPYEETVQDFTHRTMDTDVEFYTLEHIQREFEKQLKGGSIYDLPEGELKELQDQMYQWRNILKKNYKQNEEIEIMSSFLKEGYKYMIDYFTDKLDNSQPQNRRRMPSPDFPLLPVLNVSDDEENNEEDETIIAVMDDENGHTIVRTFTSTIPDMEY